MDTLASRLKLARKNAKLTQSAIAECVGISQPTYQALESGKVEKTAFLLQIADTLKVSPTWLTTGQGAMTVGNTGITVGGNNTNHGTQIGVQHHPKAHNEPSKPADHQTIPLFDIDTGALFALNPHKLPTMASGEQIATTILHSNHAFAIKNNLAIHISDTVILKNDILIVESHIPPQAGDLVLLALDHPTINRGLVARLILDISSKYFIEYNEKDPVPIPKNSVICGVVIAIKRRLLDTATVNTRLNSDWDIMSTLNEIE